MPSLSRRNFLAAAGAMPLLALTGIPPVLADEATELSSITSKAKPIDEAERKARIARAQTLMAGHGIGAVLIEPGSSLLYFTAVNWWRSERLTCAVLPVEGEPCLVTPFFEEPSVRESLGVPAEVRVWQEHEDPVDVVAGFLREKKLLERPIGIEETVRYFVVDGLRKVLPHARLVSANPVVRGCRMRKSAAEIALMQCASDVTVAAYRWVYPRIEAGMGPQDIGALMSNATQKLGGGEGFNLILLGEASAYPHGSGKPQKVVPGEVVLMDCGCNVHGYQSDISRSFVFGGKPNDEQRKVWNEVHKGQQIAFAAAKPGVPAGEVDDAVRRYYQSLGYGPDYKLPGLSHRTGHGIGMDGHEPVNLVRGEKTPLAAGMCFSDEPGIYIPGKFGIRLEDCFHMTAEGPRWFSTPPPSIDQPFD
ncbi:MAG: aminopeptidase P family protein [Dokdonella sp.]|nr:Xaa-Pro peptidase family protein [Dokdonella sp.]MBK8124015.1 aminopeptidase P family protein [Dokdonella sp.]MBP6330275.1 aminopeptidase P family protein [Dokdonella sp.]HNV09369.1 Xaa-Pro peptidase family protein [Dokdonella sp.]HPW03412.1 Xaa-Pro peptidase family protein [Dokdonella sp.]HQV49629.1 Xaa-Pro peptidase family protein [Dokdonella sp.]